MVPIRRLARLSLPAAAFLAMAAAPPELPETAAHLLAAYASGDRHHVEALISKRELYAYGSDAAEYAVGRKAFLRMFELDQKLWAGGHAAFGPFSDVSGVESGPLATLFFNVPFTLRGKTVTIRFATVWRQEYGAWKLMQSSNTIPTTAAAN